MVIVNVSSACLSTKMTLLPWNIISVSKPEHTFRNMIYSMIPCSRIFLACFHCSVIDYISSIMDFVYLWSYNLVHVEVGTSKEKMPVFSVIESFGRFLKHSMSEREPSAGISREKRSPHCLSMITTVGKAIA